MLKKFIEKIEYKNYNISIFYDDRDCNNPVVNKLNIGIVGYLPYVENLLKINVLGNLAINEDFIREIEQDENYISLPICLLETDCGYALSICRKDVKRYGLIYNTKENLIPTKETYSGDYQWAIKAFEKEVQLFSNFIEGKIYGYEINDKKYNLIESCWGYNLDNKKEIIDEAKEIINKVYSNE